MDNTIERRTLLKAAAIGVAGAAGAAALGSLTGCSGSSSDLDPQEDWLPLGTVVQTTDCVDTDVKYMIVARKPRISAVTVNDKSVSVDAGMYDYAVAVWPIGFLSDLSQKAYTGELKAIKKESISEVLFVGYQDDMESQASSLLDDADDSAVADEILSDMYINLGDQVKNAASEESSED